MKTKSLIAVLVLALGVFVVLGCSKNWSYSPIQDFNAPVANPESSVCAECHVNEHASWMKTRHSKEKYMSKVPADSLKQCGACHAGLDAHVANYEATPPSIAGMNKTEQNAVCGKCHFDIGLMGNDAINPYGKHSPIMSVGFDEKYKRQLSCLDCHSGHKGKSEMLQNITAHVCFKCHKEAIVTMGIFQPFNYLTAGKFCQLCHAVHGGSTAELSGRVAVGFVPACVPCHM